jgi:hypothetical protein
MTENCPTCGRSLDQAEAERLRDDDARNEYRRKTGRWPESRASRKPPEEWNEVE